MLIKVLDRDLYKEELAQGFQGKRDGDAGIDLRCPHDLVIPQGSAIPVPLGICVQLPPETVGWVTGRSSTSVKLGLLTHEGKIDRGYRGFIDMVRITKACRYVADFTPPSAEFPVG
jgi:dUTPase